MSEKPNKSTFRLSDKSVKVLQKKASIEGVSMTHALNKILETLEVDSGITPYLDEIIGKLERVEKMLNRLGGC